MQTEDRIIEVNASAVSSMAESVGWLELEKFLKTNIDDLRNLLEESADYDERNRGRLDAFRLVLDWPRVVRSAAEYDKLMDEADGS